MHGYRTKGRPKQQAASEERRNPTELSRSEDSKHTESETRLKVGGRTTVNRGRIPHGHDRGRHGKATDRAETWLGALLQTLTSGVRQ